MLVADDAEMLGGNRLAVLLHRRQQLGDAAAVDLLDAEELRQRLVRAADFVEDLALTAVPESPRNSAMNSRTVRLCPRSRSLATCAAR